MSRPEKRISSYDNLRYSTPRGAYRHMMISIFLCMCVCMHVCMYVGYIFMGEHQMFFNFFTVFFVHPSGPLDLLMQVWVTFGFLIFYLFIYLFIFYYFYLFIYLFIYFFIFFFFFFCISEDGQYNSYAPFRG